MLMIPQISVLLLIILSHQAQAITSTYYFIFISLGCNYKCTECLKNYPDTCTFCDETRELNLQTMLCECKQGYIETGL